jgi:phasin family protein
MVTTPEQMVAMHKTMIDAFQAVALKSVEGFEKLAELNMAAARSTMEESAVQVKALFELKDPKAFADLAMGSAQPAADKATAYARHVYQIASETNGEIARLVEQQLADSNKQMYATIDQMAKNAPAGSEGMVSFVKSAVTAANTAFDQVNNATKRVVELTEANLASAAKTTVNGAARAAKKTA